MQRTSLQKLCGLLATTAIALVLIGCNGKSGQDGTNGTNGAPGNTYVNTVNASQLTQAEWSQLTLQGKPGSITASIVSGKPTVTFTIQNATGVPVSGLTNANMGFSIAKLIPQSGSAPSRWVNYSVTSSLVAGKVAPFAFPEPENTGTLKDNGNGSYVYTSDLDITQAQAMANAAAYDANHLQSDLDDLSYVATDVHRVILSVGAPYSKSALVGAQVLSSANLSYDFIPSTGKAAAATDPSRVIADLSGCNSCHSTLSMHADRFPGIQDTKLCVVCHTDQLKYASGDSVPTDGTTNLVINGVFGSTQKLWGRALADFPNMVHHIHAGEDLYFQGYNQFGVMYNAVAYPQQKNCSKCHNGASTPAAPQGTNWNMVPSRKACGGCHDNVDFANGIILGSGAGHTVQLTDANCSATGCHTAAAIPVYHTFYDVTPLNPTTPAGISNFTYDLKKVSLNASGQPVGYFNINQDGSQVTSFNIPAVTDIVKNVATGAVMLSPNFQPIAGFIGGPSFTIQYSVPQDGNATPTDFNSARSSVSLTALLMPTNLDLSSFYTSAAAGTATSAFLNQGTLVWDTTVFSAGCWKATVTGVTAASPQNGTVSYTPPGGALQANKAVYAYSGWTSPDSTNSVSYVKPTGSQVGISLIKILTGNAAGTGYLNAVDGKYYPANLVQVCMNGSFTQINVPAYPYTPAVTTTLASTAAASHWAVMPDGLTLATGATKTSYGYAASIGGLLRPAPLQIKEADGYSSRRAVVDPNKCNSCHDRLGTKPNFHGGVGYTMADAVVANAAAPTGAATVGSGPRDNGQACAYCHTVLQTSSGWSANASVFIHALHGATERTVPFNWHAPDPDDNYDFLLYPGVLNNCEQCHVPGSYDFSATANKAALPNLLWPTVATGTFDNTAPYSGSFSNSPYVVQCATPTVSGGNLAYATGNYGGAFSVKADGSAAPSAAAATTLVSSPITAACSACHDSTSAIAHMQTNGGAFYAARSSVFAASGATSNKVEACLTCHGTGAAYDIKVVHGVQ